MQYAILQEHILGEKVILVLSAYIIILNMDYVDKSNIPDLDVCITEN